MDAVNLGLVDDVEQDCRDDHRLEDEGLDDDETHLHRVELVHTCYGDTKEQQSLKGKDGCMVAETVSYG